VKHLNSVINRHGLNFAIFTILIFLFSPLTPALQAQQDSPKIVFVLDVSGSMGDKIAGQEKLQIAKQTIYAFLPSLEQKGIDLGLLDFSGCGSVQFSVPAGPNNYNRISKRVSALQAGGGTPLAKALETAATSLQNQSGDRRIFLLSDGEETCGGSPVQVARTAAGWGIKIYVVGFDVKGATTDQLKQIADAGGGSYSGANNAQQLQLSFEKLTAEIEADVLEEMRSCVELGGGHKQSQNKKQTPGNTNIAASSPNPGCCTVPQNTNNTNLQNTVSGKIDGFMGIPWGGPQSQAEQTLGRPHSKQGRSLAKRLNVDLPAEGPQVWLYRKEKFGANCTLWLGFGKGGNKGLLWAKTRWSKPADGEKIASYARESIIKEYGPSIEKNVWVDNTGKIEFYHNWGIIEVRYYSNNMP